PHLLALSASSPIYESDDTLYASYRAILAQRLPYTGAPPALASDAEYRALLDRLFASGAIEDEWTLYWNIRPHPEYPTLEFRVTDVCPRVEDAATIALLVRSIVVGAATGRIENGVASDAAQDALLASNQWHAARFGLDAVFNDLGVDSGHAPARDAIRRLRDNLQPIAEEFGGELGQGVETILERGNGADRIRAAADRCGGLTALVDWLADESLLGTGLDRRGDQRKDCGREDAG
ncbi:MAG TPA: glutamate-cysteine ligase family protein, partial [Longimicrobiaceae bacterium]|nr:glutamate-cysteine ligase family protein [Longimicrobiaceae bacterium]